jgi:hypothetical protein
MTTSSEVTPWRIAAQADNAEIETLHWRLVVASAR